MDNKKSDRVVGCDDGGVEVEECEGDEYMRIDQM